MGLKKDKKGEGEKGRRGEGEKRNKILISEAKEGIMADKIKELEKKVKDLEKALERESKAGVDARLDGDAKIKEIEALQEALGIAEAKIVELNAELFHRETSGKGAVIEEAEKAPELTGKEKALINAACGAYGIPEECVFKARIDIDDKTGDPVAVVITQGGTRVRYRKEDEKAEGFSRLDPVKIDGKVRKKMKPVMVKD